MVGGEEVHLDSTTREEVPHPDSMEEVGEVQGEVCRRWREVVGEMR